MSLFKNLKPLTQLPPRPTITWDKWERIERNKEIFSNPESIVHRFPKHYQERYWKNILADAKPVHYRPPEHRFYWDEKLKIEVEAEVYPILPERCVEQDCGLWGGEGVVKGYYESKPFTRKKVLPRHWIPRLWFPKIRECVLFSEILNCHMKISVTERALRLIDDAFGLDNYLLSTPDIDINSRLGMDLKRQILIRLAKCDYYLDDEEQHNYIKEKYAKYVIPLEEAEWYGLDLNTAARKQQDLEDNCKKTPLKYVFEQKLVEDLSQKDVEILEDEKYSRPQKSLFGEKLFGSVFRTFAEKTGRV